MSSSSIPPRLGISLSGGGYRAAAFHLGTLKKLHTLNILSQLEVLSTISGGSITGAYYCLNKDNYTFFENSLYENLQTKDVICNVLLSRTFLQPIAIIIVLLGLAFYFLFTDIAWLFPIFLSVLFLVLFKFQFRIFPVSKRIELIYDKFFYDKKTLGELPVKPILVIGSTNLETARSFTFSRDWMQDSTYHYMTPKITFEAKKFPIARAVMASSCVPFAFTPIKINKEFFTNPEDANRVYPILVDGGVYDNQGIHKIMQTGRYSCDTIITSDAGSGLTIKSKFSNTFELLLATVDVFMSRIKKVQMVKDVYGNAATAKRQIAYLSLGWDVENCIPGFVRNLASKQITQSVIEAHQLKDEWVASPQTYEAEITAYLMNKLQYDAIEKPTAQEKKVARTVGTNLKSLSKLQVDCLMKQAAALTEIQVKLYCPSLVKTKT